MLLDDRTITVEIADVATIARLVERLVTIAEHAPDGIRRDIKAALDEMIRGIDARHPPTSPHRYQTKAAP